jgi:Zn-dependent M28 family amino/carboxypeptidase
MRRLRVFVFSALGFLILGLSIGAAFHYLHRPVSHFDGQRAYNDVLAQVAFGPRIPGSEAHAQTVAYIQSELEKADWQVDIQNTDWKGFAIKNIIAHHSGVGSPIILGAHYDSRILADQDSGPGRNEPVPGANDGASGVAVLLELARTLPTDTVPVWLVFFDQEDNGGLEGMDWIMGSRAFVDLLTIKPRAAIILDMIGDKYLNIYIERNSNAALVKEIWDQAAALGYEKQFISTPKFSMIDDHTPFSEAGIPAVDIIDFDYPYWHTAGDTADKVSAQSLHIVGETMWAWIVNQK